MVATLNPTQARELLVGNCLAVTINLHLATVGIKDAIDIVLARREHHQEVILPRLINREVQFDCSATPIRKLQISFVDVNHLCRTLFVFILVILYLIFLIIFVLDFIFF